MRSSDIIYDSKSGLPKHSGAKFHEFIGKELLPYMDEKYNTSKFKVVIGHEKSVNLMNSFLLEEEPIFQAYINLSPEFKGEMSDNIIKRVQRLNADIIYYMASTRTDKETIGTNLLSIINELNHIDNQYFKFYFDNFEGVSYHTMVMSGMARGFEKVFDFYKPIINPEMKDKVLSYEHTLD
jgi:predicted alpha/beta superfamily hydrolase